MDKDTGMFIIGVVLGGVSIALIIGSVLLVGEPSTSDEQSLTPALKRVLTPEEDSENLLYDDVFMDEAIQTYTLRSLTTSLSRLGYAKGLDCHNRAHEMGRRAYELLGSDAFKNCGIECHSGCRHGATEAFFAKNGTANLVGSIQALCGNEKDKFGLHQCIHGVGHGLLAWFDYALPDALEACDKINHPFHRDSCYSGVFMENIVGSIVDSGNKDGEVGHYTDYLNDDPHYPCNAVDDKYKAMCYWLQTDRILQLSGDITSVGTTCASAPEQFQFNCFYSMGRTTSSVVDRDPVKGFEVCATITGITDRDYCLEGVLSDLFWDETQADRSVQFCELARDSSFEGVCYNQLIVRASEVVLGDFVGKFCGKLPKKYYEQCAAQRTPAAFALSVDDEKSPVSEVLKTDNAVIRYANGKYTPSVVHISVGQQVTWINNETKESFWPASNIHPTHAAYPGSDIKKCSTVERTDIFDACEPLQPSASYSFTFSNAGGWRYHDHITPSATGTIIVSE